MRRRLWLVLPALSILCLGLAWHYGPAIIRHLVFSRPTVQHTQQADEGDVAALQARVTDALSSLGLEERHRTALHAEEQQDERGPWSVRHESWSLPSGDDPMALGRRIEALVASSDPRAEIYVVHHETHRVQVRLYAGSRLAQVISLETKLEPWPRLGRGAAPMLALVVHGVDDDPHGIRQLMEQESPIGLALSPYSPFTLRLSRDALHTNVEVLVAAADDVAPASPRPRPRRWPRPASTSSTRWRRAWGRPGFARCRTRVSPTSVATPPRASSTGTATGTPPRGRAPRS